MKSDEANDRFDRLWQAFRDAIAKHPYGVSMRDNAITSPDILESASKLGLDLEIHSKDIDYVAGWSVRTKSGKLP